MAEAFNEGVTVKVLMERHQVTMSTILEHLTKYLQAGNLLRRQEDLQNPLLSHLNRNWQHLQPSTDLDQSCSDRSLIN